jgi:hypothetical protein
MRLFPARLDPFSPIVLMDLRQTCRTLRAVWIELWRASHSSWDYDLPSLARFPFPSADRPICFAAAFDQLPPPFPPSSRLAPLHYLAGQQRFVECSKYAIRLGAWAALASYHARARAAHASAPPKSRLARHEWYNLSKSYYGAAFDADEPLALCILLDTSQVLYDGCLELPPLPPGRFPHRCIAYALERGARVSADSWSLDNYWKHVPFEHIGLLERLSQRSSMLSTRIAKAVQSRLAVLLLQGLALDAVAESVWQEQSLLLLRSVEALINVTEPAQLAVWRAVAAHVPNSGSHGNATLLKFFDIVSDPQLDRAAKLDRIARSRKLFAKRPTSLPSSGPFKLYLEYCPSKAVLAAAYCAAIGNHIPSTPQDLQTAIGVLTEWYAKQPDEADDAILWICNKRWPWQQLMRDIFSAK